MAKRLTYAAHEALGPFFEIIQEGLEGLVQGEHFYETIAENAVFEFLYEFPGWPRIIRGRAGVVDAFSGYGGNITLHSSRRARRAPLAGSARRDPGVRGARQDRRDGHAVR